MQEYMYINGHNKHNTDQNDTLQYVITERMQSSLSRILSSLSWWFTQWAGNYALGLSDHNPSRAIISPIIHRAVCLRWPPAAHAPSQHSISRYRSARLAETKRIVSSFDRWLLSCSVPYRALSFSGHQPPRPQNKQQNIKIHDTELNNPVANRSKLTSNG